jgi:hypothetical protein
VKRMRHVVILGVAAVTAMSPVACGGDDDETEMGSGGGGSTGEALPPPPDRAFRGLAAALEAQGLVVARLGASSLDGAEVGVKITGDKSGSARSFATEAKAKAYAADVAKEGDKTTIVGTVVLQAPTQDNADFFADAYEGG